MDECVAINGVHVRGFHVSFRQNHDVNFVFSHGVSNGVHLACFHKACGVPASKVESVFGWNLNIMCGSVGVVGLEDVILEPCGSGVLFGVDVVLCLPCFSCGLWCGNVSCGSV